MSAIVAALTTIEFWFGVAVGVAFDDIAKRALRRRVFADREQKKKCDR